MELELKGRFRVECFNEDGSLAWEEEFANGSTSAGLSDIFSVYFAAGTQKTLWYLGLISAAGFTGVAAADTMAAHAGWAEITDYTETVRQTWTPTVSGSTVTNAATGNFTNVTNGNIIQGIFLTSDNTKGGAGGIMWCTGLFASPRTLTAGQVLKINYTCTAA